MSPRDCSSAHGTETLLSVWHQTTGTTQAPQANPTHESFFSPRHWRERQILDVIHRLNLLQYGGDKQSSLHLAPTEEPTAYARSHPSHRRSRIHRKRSHLPAPEKRLRSRRLRQSGKRS